MINFTGYAAAPLKAVYMQTLGDNGQNETFAQLKEIGKKENFKVLAHDGDEICSDIKTSNRQDARNKWGQDNKIIIQKGGKNVVVGNSIMEDFAHKSFAKLTGMTLDNSETFFEGGNIFIGKKEDGEKYLLMGTETLDQNCAVEFLKGKKKKVTTSLVMELAEDKPSFSRKNLMREFNSKCSTYDSKVLAKIAETFGIDRSNIYVIPQANFHIDMYVRPLDFPYVLVNNPKMALENLYKLQKENPTKDYSDLIKKTKAQDVETKIFGYANIEDVSKSLKEQGLVPIEIGGLYGKRGEINFLNAIVNKREDGTLSYITNSAKPDDELEKLFKEQLREKVSSIEEVYFVCGKENFTGEGDSSIRYNLKNLHGGLHCMVCEEPNFEAWG